MNSISVNPANNHTIKEYPRIDKQGIAQQIEKSHDAFTGWKNTSFDERSVVMKKAASLLENNKRMFGELITSEMGKTLSSAIKEVEKCAWVMNYFADNASKFLADEIVQTEAKKSFVTFVPTGIVFAIMPWNFPFYQVIRFAAPALMAGNVALLKHASNVQGCANALEKLFIGAGFPENVFKNLNIESEIVAEVISNKFISAVTLTGSTTAGRNVAEAAGRNLKKCVMELGGSDAYVILEDADLDKAIEICVTGRLQNNGETCIAAKRFFVVEKIYDEFISRFVKAMQSKKMGDPMKEDTFYGPLARADLRKLLHEQVEKSIQQGAKLLCGGEIPEGEGNYYPATVLADVKPGMVCFEEELFGPVAAVVKVKDEEDAISNANLSAYGLGAAVLTGDINNGEKIAAKYLDAGNVFVNHIVVSDPRLPFGGVKESGFGRELSHYGIKEFVSIKTVWIEG